MDILNEKQRNSCLLHVVAYEMRDDGVPVKVIQQTAFSLGRYESLGSMSFFRT